jgi:polyferredoxin
METKPGSSRQGGGGGGSTRQTAVDLIDQPEPHEKHHMLPVWFFIGVILAIYGVLIFSTGIYEYSAVPPTVLANLHAPIWWGALLIVVGVIYIERSYLRRKA